MTVARPDTAGTTANSCECYQTRHNWVLAQNLQMLKKISLIKASYICTDLESNCKIAKNYLLILVSVGHTVGHAQGPLPSWKFIDQNTPQKTFSNII